MLASSFTFLTPAAAWLAPLALVPVVAAAVAARRVAAVRRAISLPAPARPAGLRHELLLAAIVLLARARRHAAGIAIAHDAACADRCPGLRRSRHLAIDGCRRDAHRPDATEAGEGDRARAGREARRRAGRRRDVHGPGPAGSVPDCRSRCIRLHRHRGFDRGSTAAARRDDSDDIRRAVGSRGRRASFRTPSASAS